MERYVWYACYGSNLLRERFMCYVQGGLIPGNDKVERGAKDPTPPIDDKPLRIEHTLFFSMSMTKWNGSGVAFLDWRRDDEACTLGRMYLITEDQFFDVVRQENGLGPGAPVSIDKDALAREGSQVIFPDKPYGRLLYLGEEEGHPIYSFTCVAPAEEMGRAPLFGGYRDVIAAGLAQTYRMDNEAIDAYLAES